MTPENEQIKVKIIDTSQRIQEVLLLLLSDNQDLRDKLKAESEQRAKETAGLRDRLEQETRDLRSQLDREISERTVEGDHLKHLIEENAKAGDAGMNELKDLLEREQNERIEQAGDIHNYFNNENEARKKNLDDVNEWIRAENEKRQKEAEELRERMEREKRELQEFIDKDNKAMADRIAQENAERQKKEEEMKDRLKQAQEASENGTIQLYKKMQAENCAREQEIADLKERLNREKAELAERMEKEKQEIKDKLEKENQELRDKLSGQKELLKTNIDGNHNTTTKRLNELAEKLANQIKNGSTQWNDLANRLSAESSLLKSLMSKPLSIFFDAYRNEDIDNGGEEYLTFTGTRTNLGNGMNAKSGIFTAPSDGTYMFTIHICTHDMRKGLLSMRCNGNELASFYDQNHDSNHKNSMASQSVIADLSTGDKIQIYMYTHTGLMDKKSNFFTHFCGIFLRPKGFLENLEAEPVSNGH